MAAKPATLTLRAYQVGFGDCFLLTFRYSRRSGLGDRHVLIDFGSTGLPADQAKREDRMRAVAEDIRAVCGGPGGKLHAVVATHRHKDHISGFATAPDGEGPGDIIAALKPDVVVQPWTEDPDAQPDARSASRAAPSADSRAFAAALHNMQRFSQAALDELDRRAQAFSPRARNQLSFLGENNLPNRSAIDNLRAMSEAGKAAYVHFGSQSGLENVLPGVKTTVLGPPTLDQTDSIRKQRARDAAEFWHLQAAAGQAFTAAGNSPFDPQFHVAGSDAPAYSRWFLPRMDALRNDQLLQIVRALDNALNNTSVILLFEAGSKKLLFPGDAQIENWSYALEQAEQRPALKKKLMSVDLYKVGHHGSLNATPKSLWNLFEHRSPQEGEGRMRTVVSTMAGKHGSADAGTEVPRGKLVDALRAHSDYVTTQSLKQGDLAHVIEIELN